MRTSIAFALGLVACAWAGAASFAWPSPHSLPGFAYVSPAPGSSLHPPTTNVIVRPGGRIDPASVAAEAIQVTGSVSGAHPGRIKLSDDGETVLFMTETAYTACESVTCVIAPGLRAGSETLPGAAFVFQIMPAPAQARTRPAETALLEERAEAPLFGAAPFLAMGPSASSADTLPADFPAIRDSVWGATAPGAYFVSDISFTASPYASHLMILLEDGSPIWWRRTTQLAFDFKVQPNRWLTYYDGPAGQFYALNARYALVDSFHCGNGYFTDLHELRILPNGHALLLSYDPQTIDMSAVVPGGQPDAEVTGLVVQELDRDKDVVFQWRSWDHFQLTDVAERSLTTTKIDYVHGNAIEADADGNLLISSRHLDEITKIDRTTGKILWRLGGKNNEFTFVNDPERFYQQHAVRRLPNGHVTLFDNGNGHVPPHSRAVEYALDEAAKTATLVWQYRNTPDVYGFAMGYAQRLANGNTVIGWGTGNPSVTEVSAAGEKLAELCLPVSISSYRAFKYEWPPLLPVDVALSPPSVATSSADPWIRTVVEGGAFDADSIDVASARLGGVAAEGIEGVASDRDGDGRREVTLRFPRAALASSLTPGAHSLELTARLTSGEFIRGRSSVRGVAAKPAAVRVLSQVGATPVELVVGAPALAGPPVTLSVFDVRGRLVRHVAARTDGEGFLTWDGRGAQGQRLPSGVYHLRVSGAAGHADGRVVLLR